MITLPTTYRPTDPNALYMRLGFRQWFWGPFQNENDLIAAILLMDENEPYWDYDSFTVAYGADPLPEDFVHGFPTPRKSLLERIKNARRI